MRVGHYTATEIIKLSYAHSKKTTNLIGMKTCNWTILLIRPIFTICNIVTSHILKIKVGSRFVICVGGSFIYLGYTFVLRFALKLIFVAFFASVGFITTIFAILIAIAIFELINATFQWAFYPVPSTYLIELATVPSKDRTKSHLLLEPGS